MASIAKIKSGYKANHSGKHFELLIIAQAKKQKYKVIQIPSGCRQAGKTLIRVKTPFDFVLVKEDHVLFIDAKSTTASNFTASQITPHQLQNLLEIENKGQAAGYLIYFSEKKEVYFYSASLLFKIYKGHKDIEPIRVGTNELIDFFACSIPASPHSPADLNTHNHQFAEEE